MGKMIDRYVCEEMNSKILLPIGGSLKKLGDLFTKTL